MSMLSAILRIFNYAFDTDYLVKQCGYSARGWNYNFQG